MSLFRHLGRGRSACRNLQLTSSASGSPAGLRATPRAGVFSLASGWRSRQLPFCRCCRSRGCRRPMLRRPTSNGTHRRPIPPNAITGSTARRTACYAVAAAAVRTPARPVRSHPPSPGSAPASIPKTAAPTSSPIATAAESRYVRPASPAFAMAAIENYRRTARRSTTTSSGASARRRQPTIARPRRSSGWRTPLVNDLRRPSRHL